MRARRETDRFRSVLMNLRSTLGLTQRQFAVKLGISKRTLSNWECGYWLPPFKQRLHVVMSLQDAPPEYVLEIADALGVSVAPGVEPLMQTFRDAVDPPPPAAPPPPPPRAAPEPVAFRRAMDAVVRDAADGLDVPANELRAAIGRALALGAEVGATLAETQDAVAVRAKPRAPQP